MDAEPGGGEVTRHQGVQPPPGFQATVRSTVADASEPQGMA